MSAVALDVAAVRARVSALDRPLAFLDAPGGTTREGGSAVVAG
jgi:hypothetical protein